MKIYFHIANVKKLFPFFVNSPGGLKSASLLIVSWFHEFFHLCCQLFVQAEVLMRGFQSTTSCSRVLSNLSPQKQLWFILPSPLPAGGDLLPWMLHFRICKQASFLFSCQGAPQTRLETAPPPACFIKLLPALVMSGFQFSVLHRKP